MVLSYLSNFLELKKVQGEICLSHIVIIVVYKNEASFVWEYQTNLSIGITMRDTEFSLNTSRHNPK